MSLNNSLRPCRFNLITGFLGSGKTTLLSHLLKELSQEKRIAVIQNEFAPTGVDGKELQQSNTDFKLVEINNGSVFCVCQLTNFVSNMQKLIEEYKPEIIFLEASGLADPISVVELLQTDELKDKVTLDMNICLVDAPNYFKGLSVVQRFKHQLMVADHIIINKVDIFKGDLKEIKDSIQELNSYAQITETSYSKVNWLALCSGNTTQGEAAKRFEGQQSEGRPDTVACVLRSHEKLCECNLKAFLHHLKQDCPRIKGFLNLDDGRVVSVHTVFDEVEIKEVSNYTGRSELIAFGKDLTIGKLRGVFNQFVK
ncbi:GTP-binding protein [Labilibacter marinus]|uniref:GTP-binding protein n=1 Tax=Labilibacter marinus TaxID=1477105 RepID=UPI0008377C7F|nr:GTP-binding protein [Labilibacter marinus]